MSDMSHDWSFESFPIETSKCACCGESFQIASGMIYDDAGDDLAIYVANLADHSGEKRVILHIGLLGKDRKRMKRKKIDDFILENDPYIGPFLDDDCTPEAPEEKQE